VQAVKVIANPLDSKSGGNTEIHWSDYSTHSPWCAPLHEAMDETIARPVASGNALAAQMMPDWRRIQETLGRVTE